MSGFLNPAEVLKKIKLRKTMIAADFGCGAGGFTLPLAKILEEGKIYAIDIQEEMLSCLRSRAAIENLKNIETKRCDLEILKSTGLSDNSIDLVLIPNLLFQVENKQNIISEAERILKLGGKILILDWNPGANLGPKESRVSEDKIKEISSALKLELKEDFKAGDYHWGLIFEKTK